MKLTVRILAQVFENYGYNDGSVYWKAKGGQEFTIESDLDTVMYMDSGLLVSKLNWVLKTQCNDLYKFEYLSHTVLLAEAINLGRVEFDLIDHNAFAAFNSKSPE